MSKISAVVLAAGLSRRMGDQNKLIMLINGRPMIEQVLDHVAESKCHELIVVSNEDTRQHLPEDYRIVVNDEPNAGMTSSIQVGVQQCAKDATGYMICLGDQPFITTLEYDAIITAFEGAYVQDPKTLALPHFEGKRGNPTIFSKAYRKEILAHKEPEGCREIVSRNSGHWLQVEMNSPSILVDIDTMEDYQSFL